MGLVNQAVQNMVTAIAQNNEGQNRWQAEQEARRAIELQQRDEERQRMNEER